MTDVVRRRIPWHPSPHGGPLGRHVQHDPASRAYAVTAAPGALRSRLWTRHVPIYDQGVIGDCTAESICGAVSTGRLTHHIRSQHTIQAVYRDETQIDGFGDPWPPNDRGSSGLAACKIAKARGWISEYRHAFSLDEALAALQLGPVITGVDWMDSFDRPDAAGLCTWSPDAQVRGGHEVCVVGINVDARTVRFANSWDTSWGDNGYGHWTWDTWGRLLDAQGDVTQPVR